MRETAEHILHPYSITSHPSSAMASAGQPLRLIHPQQYRSKFCPLHKLKAYRSLRKNAVTTGAYYDMKYAANCSPS
jgi:hypothetical protein